MLAISLSLRLDRQSDRHAARLAASDQCWDATIACSRLLGVVAARHQIETYRSSITIGATDTARRRLACLVDAVIGLGA